MKVIKKLLIYVIIIVMILYFIVNRVGDTNNVSPANELKVANSISNEKSIENKVVDEIKIEDIKIEEISILNSFGKLSVENGKIIGENKKEFVIQGVSTHSIFEFGHYVNYNTFKTLKENFDVNTIRLTMYTQPELGYSKSLHSKVDEGVKYATELGLYVILDWHILKDNDPNINKESAKEFFKEMAYKYKDYDNIIYEICNEPNSGVTWDTVKTYALEVIPVIREFDNDAIIIVGTPDYCKDLESAQNNPITEYENIMYSLHFYAATHKSELREKLKSAVDSKFPVIVSEFGITDASGSGVINEEEANLWINYLRENKIGYVCWNLSNKNESSSILNPQTTNLSNWNDEELSQTGLWLKKTYKSR